MSKSQPRRRGGRRAPVLAALCAALLLPTLTARAQTGPEPRREQLLNGLRIILLSRPGDSEVTLKLRVHSGAAFDLAGKEGLMTLLSGAFFDPNTREYVTDELGGRLEVKTGYDSIDVTLAGRSTDFDRLLELLRNGVINTQLTPEAVERVRGESLKNFGAATAPAAADAERLVAARLFHPFPYARPVGGTAESVKRVERTDLLLARERFLHPDNSTLVIVGGFDPRRVMRTLRQSLGGWRKSDRPVPATFRRPDPTDARTLVIDRAGSKEVELRLAVRGLARADRDAPAARLLTPLVRERWLAALPELRGNGSVVVRHDAMREGGIFTLGATLRSAADMARALEAARKVLRELSEKGPTSAEFEAAKAAAVSSLNQGAQVPAGMADSWLDEHTYDTPAVTSSEVARAINALNVSEVQRVAARLFLHTPLASVAVGDAAQLREELARTGGYEVFGEAAARAPEPPKPQPDKQQPGKPRLELKRP